MPVSQFDQFPDGNVKRDVPTTERHHIEQCLFENRTKTTSAGAASKGCVGDGQQGIVGEDQFGILKRKIPLVLLDESGFGFCQDLNERFLVQVRYRANNRQPTNEFGDQAELHQILGLDLVKQLANIFVVGIADVGTEADAASTNAMLDDVFERDHFITTGSKAWKCDDLLDLEIHATALINPTLTFQGAPVDNAASLLDSLSSHDHSKDWNVTMEGDAVRIDLDEGESFPVEAELSIAFMKPVYCTLEGPGEFSAMLQLENRSLLIGGVSDAHNFSFEPDINEVKNEAVRALLRGKIPKTEIAGTSFNQGRGNWTIPSLAGTISVSFNGKVNRIMVSSETRCLVFVDELSHLPEESGEMLRLRELAEHGGVASQYMLGALYDKTSTDKLHGRFSFGWMSLAAQQGDLPAEHDVGNAYLNGIGVDRNYPKAFFWFSKAAEQGYPKAFNSVALCHEHGYGVEQDHKKAEEYYRKAIESGDLDAHCNLGLLYANNESPLANPEEAIRLLNVASRDNHPYATYSLGFAYLHGLGVERDLARAKTLFTKAVGLGSQPAADALKKLE